jgi:hypothetical protein
MKETTSMKMRRHAKAQPPKLKPLNEQLLIEFMRDHVSDDFKSGGYIQGMLRTYGYRHSSFANVITRIRRKGEWRIVASRDGYKYTESKREARNYLKKRRFSLFSWLANIFELRINVASPATQARLKWFPWPKP